MIIRLLSLITVGLLTVLLSGCGEQYETRGEEISTAVEKMNFDEPVYWLEMFNAFNEWEKTILVFGYMGNYEACEEIRALATEGSPNRRFRCTKV